MSHLARPSRPAPALPVNQHKPLLPRMCRQPCRPASPTLAARNMRWPPPHPHPTPPHPTPTHPPQSHLGGPEHAVGGQHAHIRAQRAQRDHQPLVHRRRVEARQLAAAEVRGPLGQRGVVVQGPPLQQRAGWRGRGGGGGGGGSSGEEGGSALCPADDRAGRQRCAGCGDPPFCVQPVPQPTLPGPTLHPCCALHPRCQPTRSRLSPPPGCAPQGCRYTSRTSGREGPSRRHRSSSRPAPSTSATSILNCRGTMEEEGGGGWCEAWLQGSQW